MTLQIGRVHFFLLFWVSVASFLFEGCRTSAPRVSFSSPSSGLYHEVQKGETLWSIARSYQVDVQALAEANRLPEPSKLSVGQLLYIRVEKK